MNQIYVSDHTLKLLKLIALHKVCSLSDALLLLLTTKFYPSDTLIRAPTLGAQRTAIKVPLLDADAIRLQCHLKVVPSNVKVKPWTTIAEAASHNMLKINIEEDVNGIGTILAKANANSTIN